MEFDILNELLTSTVYSLFNTKTQESSIENKKRVRELQKLSKPDTVNLRRSAGQDSIISGMSGGSSADPERRVPPCESVQIWMTTQSARRLKESLNKLGLDNQMLRQKNQLEKYLQGLSLDDLVIQKKKVKNELKIYDSDFNDLFKRVPSRAQKQPFRPLYGYYKKLKESIDKKGGREDIQKRIQVIKEERKNLRERIQNYQTSFENNHNRKIRYVRDIQPIQTQYRRYKELKAQLIRLQEALRNEM